MHLPSLRNHFAAVFLLIFLATNCQSQMTRPSEPGGGSANEANPAVVNALANGAIGDTASASERTASSTAGAQKPVQPARSTSATATALCSTIPDLGDVYVHSVSRSDPPLSAEAARVPAALRHEIEIQVHGLNTLLERARCTPGARKIVLFLKGRPVASATPYPPVDPKGEKLKFQLERNEDSRAVWTYLLGRPSFKPREVAVSVGLTDEYPVRSDKTILLEVIPMGWFWTWALVLALLFMAFLALATKSDVVRDSITEVTGTRKPYSLAKLQAAWWFFLILTSYLFIGLITGDYSTSITGTVIALMGISAATAVGSAVIDAGKRTAAPATAVPVVSYAISVSPKVTKGWWWLDIVSDQNGVNFHRFQMAAWTTVLGVIFVHEVYAALAMPEFDNTLLGLLGISSGTYLGLKTTTEMQK